MIRQLKEESESLSKNNQLQEQQILEKENVEGIKGNISSKMKH